MQPGSGGRTPLRPDPRAGQASASFSWKHHLLHPGRSSFPVPSKLIPPAVARTERERKEARADD